MWTVSRTPYNPSGGYSVKTTILSDSAWTKNVFARFLILDLTVSSHCASKRFFFGDQHFCPEWIIRGPMFRLKSFCQRPELTSQRSRRSISFYSIHKSIGPLTPIHYIHYQNHQVFFSKSYNSVLNVSNDRPVVMNLLCL